ncbi:hypothetical protein [Geomonas limicola]|uniref:hypothetical protein n=1 Tax=Geomonas limicola TaxID=2740186 RepID=UPI001622FE24|nr:hypothetical protein [Geomonas limicola]
MSTARRLTRYSIGKRLSCGPVLALLLVSLVLGAGRARGAEEPLSPEFLEYLGTVESGGIKDIDNLSLEEFVQFLKSALKKAVGQKKDDQGKEKGNEHADAPKH